MTYSIPTNKLRDLIAVLQTLDPDIEHSFEEVIVETPGRRIIRFGGFTNEAEMIAEITDQINPRCNATTVEGLVTFINTLDEQNDELKETIKRIREALDD